VRFTGTGPFPDSGETIIGLQSSEFAEVHLYRQSTSTKLRFVIFNSGLVTVEAVTNSGVLLQSTWLTLVATYRASTKEFQLTVNNALCVDGTALADVTDKTLSTSRLGLGYGYFNGDIAGAFVVDEYLSTDATSAIVDLMVRGVDLTADTYTSSAPARSTSLTVCTCNAGFSGPDGGTCTACVAGKYKASAGSAACTGCPAGEMI
jgi:hypothetical protein